MPDYPLIRQSLHAGDARTVQRLVSAALGEGRPSAEVLDAGLLAGMSTVIEEFRLGLRHVPAALLASRALRAGWSVLAAPPDGRTAGTPAPPPRVHVLIDPCRREIRLRLDEPGSEAEPAFPRTSRARPAGCSIAVLLGNGRSSPLGP